MRTVDLHTSDGVVVNVPGVGILIAYGDTVPADTSVGYATGCLFMHTDGSTGTCLYVNQGSNTSSAFAAFSMA